MQGKDAHYIRGFLDGYSHGQAAFSYSADGFDSEGYDCQLCGNNTEMHWFYEVLSICPHPLVAERKAAAARIHTEYQKEREHAENQAKLTPQAAEAAITATSGNVTAASRDLRVGMEWLRAYLKENDLWDHVVALREARQRK